MENLPANAETSTTNTETAKMSILSHNQKQSDVAIARNLVIEIGSHCWRGKGDMLHRVYVACTEFATKQGRKPVFTDRRIKGFYHLEAARADYSEIIELAKVAEAQQAAKERIKNARIEHSKFINRVAATVDALNLSDEEFHRQSIEALSALSLTENVQQVRKSKG